MRIKIFLQKKLIKGKFKNFIFFLIRVSTRFFLSIAFKPRKIAENRKIVRSRMGSTFIVFYRSKSFENDFDRFFLVEIDFC